MSGKDYIIPSLGGRLGNQMFMIAHAYAQSLKQNRELKISRHDLRYEGNEYDLFHPEETVQMLAQKSA